MKKQTFDENDDENGSWAVLPDSLTAAMHATPFPDYDPDGEWEIRAAVYDFNISQMTRIAEQESV